MKPNTPVYCGSKTTKDRTGLGILGMGQRLDCLPVLPPTGIIIKLNGGGRKSQSCLADSPMPAFMNRAIHLATNVSLYTNILAHSNIHHVVDFKVPSIWEQK